MTRTRDLLLTALAPAIWGSTYIVTTEVLPQGYPLTLAVLRALPAGLLLMAITRSLPSRSLLGRIFLLGAFNFAVFWSLLFVAAYRLPGGVAATLGAMQPLMVLGLAHVALGTRVRPAAVFAAGAGVLGVALLVLGPGAGLDRVGILAGLGGALSMAAGTVFSRKWQPPVPALTFTGWQLTAGGLLLLPVALIAEPALPPLEVGHIAGFTWLGLIGGALTYWLWFRGVARIEPGAISMLGLVSPVTAVGLGWIWLGQSLSPLQAIGAVVVLASVWLGQWTARRSSSEPQAKRHSDNRDLANSV